MLKTKKKEVEKPIKEPKQPVIINKQQQVDMTPLLNKLTEAVNYLTTISQELPKLVESVNQQSQELNKTSKVGVSWQDLENIQNRLSEMTTLLGKFTELKNPNTPQDLSPVIEAIKNMTVKSDTKPVDKWVFDIMKDNNGIYKVIATSGKN